MKHKPIVYPNKLKEKRLQCNLTQKDVSAHLKFATENRISRWEQGQSIPSIYNLLKLAKLYNVHAEELYPEADYSIPVVHQQIADSLLSSASGTFYIG